MVNSTIQHENGNVDFAPKSMVQNYVWPPLTPDQARLDPCVSMFIYGKCKTHGCVFNHNLNLAKTNKGVCFHEFKSPHSCTRGDECWHSHDIPSVLRTNTNYRAYINRQRSRVDEFRMQKASRKSPKPAPCVTTFLYGKNKCNDEQCQRDHNLNFKRLSKGVCFKEFFDRGSCSSQDCPHEHRIPEELRYDENFIAEVHKEKYVKQK